MQQVKANPILKFNENQLQIVRKTVGYEDLKRLKQDIEQLRDWFKKQNHFRIKKFDDEYLERWLIINKGSIEKTKLKFDRLCICTNLMPEFLQNFDIKNEFRISQEVVYNFVLPIPTQDNYRILVTQWTGTDHKDFDFMSFYRHIILIGHYILYNDYCLGYEWIGDLRNMTVGVITQLNPLFIHKALNLIVEALAQRVKRIHMIGGSAYFDTAIAIIKQGMSTKLKERLIIHPNVESLYYYFPREQLPKEFGGNGKSTKEMNDLVFKELSTDDHIAKVKYMEQFSTNESYRFPYKYNEEYSGMPGSFKTLSVD